MSLSSLPAVRCHVAATVAIGAFLTVLASPAFAQQKSRRMTADAVKLKGLELIKTFDADLKGDGRRALLGVAKSDKGIQLVVIGEDAEGAVVTQVAPLAGGKELATVEAKALVPPTGSQQVILEVYDETPDEKVKRVRVYSGRDGRLREIFSSVLMRAKRVDDRANWETDPDVVRYGDAFGGWYFADLEDDGVVEVLVRRKPQIVSVPGDGKTVRLLTGVREQVWGWDDNKQRYQQRTGGERLVDFLPALAIKKARASSTYIPPAELKEMRARALADALMNEGKGGSEGAMGGELDFGLEDLGQPAPKPSPKSRGPAKSAPKAKAKKEPEPEIEVDRTAYTDRIFDKNLATAWIEDEEKGPGKGEWVELELEEEANIKMVRVVAGCVDTQRTYRGHNVPESFLIRFDNGSDATVDRRARTAFDPPVVAFADNLVKLSDRPWAKTTLVFFDGKRSASRVRITLDRVIKQGKGNHTCISEVSVH